jgi:glucosamine-6-phosphate deaminase
MDVRVYENRSLMSDAAAAHAARRLRETIASKGRARIIAATGASQLQFLDRLATEPAITWRSVEFFHLDEYVGLPISHPASFRRVLLDHLVTKTGIERYHLLDGEADPAEVIRRVGQELTREPVDIAFVGIGENGHLAFNDPPADFDVTDPYILVTLDEACRRQQVGEGWFATFEDVPTTAISMSVRQILKSLEILVIVPDARKAEATRAALEGPVSPDVPASILRTHPHVTLFLDEPAASALDPATRARLSTVRPER